MTIEILGSGKKKNRNTYQSRVPVTAMLDTLFLKVKPEIRIFMMRFK